MGGGAAAVTVAARPNQSVLSYVCEARRQRRSLLMPLLLLFFLTLFKKYPVCMTQKHQLKTLPYVPLCSVGISVHAKTPCIKTGRACDGLSVWKSV